MSSSAFAGDPHHEDTDSHTTLVTHVNGNTEGVALAMSMAAQQFDFGTYRLQGSVGAASYDGTHAISLGVGKRFGKNRALFNGSLGLEQGRMGISGAVNWRF